MMMYQALTPVLPALPLAILSLGVLTARLLHQQQRRPQRVRPLPPQPQLAPEVDLADLA
jgi:hypothetical protein